MMWLLLNFALSVLLVERACTIPVEPYNPSKTPDGQTLWDGDMLLSDDQLDVYFGDGNLNLRKAINMKNMLWPNGVVLYRFTPSASVDRKIIEETLKYWTNNTCVTFKEIPEEIEEPHLIFVKKSGCWSDIGRKFWHNGQELSVGYGCETIGRIAHEIGHALGFYHEHSRPDRDQHIKLFKDNYDTEKKENFKKQTFIDNYNIPYDYESIMHYSIYAFSKNKKKTIAPLDPTKEFVLGQREKISFFDLKLANMMYKCNAHCDQNVVCANEGFLTSSCQCKCKPGFTGNLCEQPSPKGSEGCGGYVYSETKIQSPNYPKFYPSDNKCVWWIKAPEGKKVEVRFDDFDIYKRDTDDNDCYFDKMEVRTEDIFNGPVYCGEELKGKSMTSNDNNLVLVFDSKTRLNTGFSVSVKFV